VTTGACRVGNVSRAGGGAEFLLSAGASEGEFVCAGSDCWPLNCEGFLEGGGCLRLNSFIEMSFSSKPPFGGGSELMMALLTMFTTRGLCCDDQTRKRDRRESMSSKDYLEKSFVQLVVE
jgi:hypothetical protein